MSDIVIVILAAGQSKRMGQTKQLLNWGEDLLITHSIKTALLLKNHQIVVVLGANYQKIYSQINHFPVRILNNKSWKKGLSSSIGLAVKYIEDILPNAEGVLFTLADQPLISCSYLEQLIQRFQINKRHIVATTYQSRFGVPALFDKCYFQELQLLKSNRGAKDLLNMYSSDIIGIESEGFNIDLDYMHEYLALHKQYFNS